MDDDDGENPLDAATQWCTCGSPHYAYETLEWLLAAFANAPTDEPRLQFLDWLEGREPGLFWIALYAIDRAGLIDHGVGVRAGFLTKEGEQVLEWLRR